MCISTILDQPVRWMSLLLVGNILLVKGSYYSMSYVMDNEIKYRHKGESNIRINIITGIYYIDLSVVISFMLNLNFGNVCNLY